MYLKQFNFWFTHELMNKQNKFWTSFKTKINKLHINLRYSLEYLLCHK